MEEVEEAEEAVEGVAEATARFVRRCGETRPGEALGGEARRGGAPACVHCGGPARPAVLLFGNDVAAIYGTPTSAACWAAEVAPPHMHATVIRGAAARKRACAGGLLQPSRSAVEMLWRCCGWRGDCV